ncbi:MAG: hypothetical protein M3Z31_11545 [Pseudomonadota bacterium]|nr:hypothetical protein [Pseudomonadota bacterium]
MNRTTIAVLALGLITSSAMAATRDPGVNERQANQNARIEQGVASGQLTRGEARDLKVEQRGIRAEERAFKRDGKLTKQERKQLHRDLNRSSRDIHKQKHDAQTR